MNCIACTQLVSCSSTARYTGTPQLHQQPTPAAPTKRLSPEGCPRAVCRWSVLREHTQPTTAVPRPTRHVFLHCELNTFVVGRIPLVTHITGTHKLHQPASSWVTRAEQASIVRWVPWVGHGHQESNLCLGPHSIDSLMRHLEQQLTPLEQQLTGAAANSSSS